MSIKNLVEAEDSEKNEPQEEYAADSDEEVAQAIAKISSEQLNEAWEAVSHHFKEELSFSNSLKSSKVEIKDGKIQVEVQNGVQKNNFAEHNERLLQFLKRKLAVNKLKLNIYVAQNANGSSIPYTDKEKFIELSKRNPALAELQKALGLDPEF